MTDVRAWLRQLDWSLVATILAIKALILFFGAVAYQAHEDRWLTEAIGWLEIWNRWDGPHYQDLAEYGYQATGEMRRWLVFYPLFPWLTRLVALVFGNYLVSAFVVSGIASVAAGLLLHRLVALDHSAALAWRAVWFLLIFPTSYFLHINYTESSFIALALASFLAARREKWLLAGVLGAFAGLSRVNGLMLIPALIVEALYQGRHSRRWDWRWLWIGLTGLGFGGYLLLNQYVTGDPFTFLIHQRESWYKSLEWPWTGIRTLIESTPGQPTTQVQLAMIMELLCIALSLIATLICLMTMRPSYGVWMLANWLLMTGTSWILSVPRYILIMFPIYILLARLAERRFWFATISAGSLMLLTLWLSWFTQGSWAFWSGLLHYASHAIRGAVDEQSATTVLRRVLVVTLVEILPGRR